MAISGSRRSVSGSEPSTKAPYRSRAPGRPLRLDRRRPDLIRHALHDRLGPGLANLQLRLSLLMEAGGLTGPSLELVARLRQEVHGLVEELGRIVHNEPPAPLERGDLVRALQEACQNAEGHGLLIDFTARGDPVPLRYDIAELLYRAVLEGTANVKRHARARRCLVRLTYAHSRVTVEVRDNGLGPKLPAHGRPGPVGLGLASLWRAARRLGGSARLESMSAGGTRLIVQLPLKRRLKRSLGPETTGRNGARAG